MDFPLSNSLGGASDTNPAAVWDHPFVRLGVGICDTTGKIWGEVSQSAAIGETKPAVLTDNSHSLFLYTGYETTTWDLYRYKGDSPARYDNTITYSYAVTSTQAAVNTTGS